MTTIKTHNGGRWTAARFNSFIRGALRAASVRWPPKNEVKKAARVKRGVYMCVGYGQPRHQVTSSILTEKGRVNNVQIDHIDPVVNPTEGFQNWDTYITRMFPEADGLQLLCRECHHRKTGDEKKRKQDGK